MFDQYKLWLSISQSRGIARRYFVVNGFDGALTMLGLITGFYISEDVELSTVITACLGAAIALGMSGLSSAYISETAEKKKELRELEETMIADLGESAHGRAARLLPIVIAMINGLAPFVIAVIIIFPLWLVQLAVALPFGPLESAMLVAFVAVFLLGVFLGKIEGRFWLWAGLRTLFVAVITLVMILLLNP